LVGELEEAAAEAGDGAVGCDGHDDDDECPAVRLVLCEKVIEVLDR
jgi:hypothetical protein